MSMKDKVAVEIRALTRAIEATEEEDRIMEHLKEIRRISNRWVEKLNMVIDIKQQKGGDVRL